MTNRERLIKRGWRPKATRRALEVIADGADVYIDVRPTPTLWGVYAVYADGSVLLRECVSEYAAHLALAEWDDMMEQMRHAA